MRNTNATIIFAFALGALMGAIVLWAVFQYSDTFERGISDVVSRSDTPINEELFNNSIITVWSASVEGILTQVNEDTIVIERPDERLTLTIEHGFTSFRAQQEEPSGDEEPSLGGIIPLQDAPIGTRVQGFIVFDESRMIEGTDGVAGVITPAVEE